MQMKYKIGAGGRITGVWFDGLNGHERVTSVSQALTRLRVGNPALVFAEDAKAGRFDEMSDEEYYRLLHSMECIAKLWRYKGDMPEDKSTRLEMNALKLLANAIETIIEQDIQLEKLRGPGNGPDFDDWPDLGNGLDFAPVDEERLREIEEAEVRKQAMDAWERFFSSGEEPELDESGNPPVRRDDKKQIKTSRK